MGDKIYQLEASHTSNPRVDREEGVIRGVSVITGGIEARGHGLHVDKVCLDQMCQFAVGMKQVPLKINHGGGADTVAGFLTNFQIDGNQLRGDIHLLKSHEKFDHLIEMAERMPTGIGLSAAFAGAPEKIGDKSFARVNKLVSVDWVANPAANLNGLFEDKTTVDTLSGDMDKPVELSDILNGLNQFKEEIGTKLADLEKFRDEVLTGFDDAIEQDDVADEVDAEAELSDEEIDAIAELLEEIQAVDDSEVEADADVEAEPAMAEFSERLNAIEMALVEEAEAEEHAEFEANKAAVEEKLTLLSEKLENLQAENEALRLAAQSAPKAPTPTFLSANGSGEFKTEFEARVDALQKGDRKLTYSQAFEEVTNHEPHIYSNYLESKGLTITMEG